MKVTAYFHIQWNDEDLKLLQVRRGDPQGQARVEVCTLLSRSVLGDRFCSEHKDA